MPGNATDGWMECNACNSVYYRLSKKEGDGVYKFVVATKLLIVSAMPGQPGVVAEWFFQSANGTFHDQFPLMQRLSGDGTFSLVKADLPSMPLIVYNDQGDVRNWYPYTYACLIHILTPRLSFLFAKK